MATLLVVKNTKNSGSVATPTPVLSENSVDISPSPSQANQQRNEGEYQHITVPDNGSRIAVYAPNLGYTFIYPDGWYVEPATVPTTVTQISNYNQALVPDGYQSENEGSYKIEIYKSENIEGLTIDQWYEKQVADWGEPVNPEVQIIHPIGRPYPTIDVKPPGSNTVIRYIAADGYIYGIIGYLPDGNSVPFYAVADSFRLNPLQ